MKIIQISDIHLADKDEEAYGLNNYQRLETIIKDALIYEPDLWVFAGDICLYEPHEFAYHFLKKMVHTYQLNAEFIPGNHDDPEMMSRILTGRSQKKIYKVESNHLCDLIFLDTQQAEISYEEMSLFRNIPLNSKPLLVFMHHPPVLSGVPYMDNNYPFSDEKGRNKLLKLIESTGRKCFIFCGHYHNPRSISYLNWQVFIGPTIHIHVEDRKQEFQILHKHPGYRIIEITESKTILTWERYVYS